MLLYEYAVTLHASGSIGVGGSETLGRPYEPTRHDLAMTCHYFVKATTGQ
jgi:hypothetical protein